MADAYKVLGQAAPSAATETVLYTVPAATSATASTLTVCNRSSTSGATFRVSVSKAGAATTSKDYVIYDLALSASNVYMATVGLTLATTDVVRVFASSANLSFSLFGVEIT
jgi:hypothetical protein